MSIFARLNYDSNAVAGFVQPLAPSTIKQMNTMPQLMNSWQQADVANGATDGYFQNPVANTVSNIITLATDIIELANASNDFVMMAVANTLAMSTGPSFLAHTNRLSGVEPVNTDTVNLPHYSTAVSTGKLLQYITFQSDGIEDNSPIVSNFTSIFTGNTLNAMYITMQADANNISNTMTMNVANDITANIGSVITLMNTRQAYDVDFYTESISIVNDFNAVKPFGQMGQTEKQLTSTLVGSPKLISRLNP